MTPSIPDPPGTVQWIARTLEGAGHETWVVGGAVRDALLGLDHEDWDLATRARPQQVQALFPRTVPIGIDHGTVGVLARGGQLFEVTTFRRDVETFGRRAVVEFADRMEDDLARRDFTINAVAWHPLRRELLDPFEGVADLARRRLRTVGTAADRFQEDFLRVLRGLRFAGRYRLRVEPTTWSALVDAVPRVAELSPERVREELMKVLALDPRPSGSLALYAAVDAFDVLLPEVAHRLEDGESPARDPLARRLLAVDVLPRSRPTLRLAALFGGQERSDAAAALLRLRFSNAEVREVSELTASLRLAPFGLEGEQVRRWLSAVGPNRLNAWARIQVARSRVARAHGEPAAVDVPAVYRAARAQLRAGVPLTVHELAVDGRTLIGFGLRPGPIFGTILEQLLDRCLAEPDLNQPDRLVPLARALATEIRRSEVSR